jgi:ParB/RepB/Spo0J family partition protein
MTLMRESGLKVHDIPVGKLDPNPWNPNRVPPGMYAKLRAYIEREGFVEPLVVRRQGDRYQILGGEHRWRIAKELGHENVPCVTVDLDDRRAKILTVNLNELKGQSVPALLASLIHELTRETSLADLETQLPYTLVELEDLQALLQIPDGLDLLLEQEAERMERERPRVLSFVVPAAQEALVEEAIGKAMTDVAGTSRGAALTHIARTYLERKGVEGE